MDPQQLTQIALYAAPVVTFVIGVLLGRRTGGASRAQVAALEGQREALAKELDRARSEVNAGVEALDQTRQELEQYRGQVAQHFSGTSSLLRDLTLQYRAVYDHLAEGASELCSEGFPGLPADLAPALEPLAAAWAEDARASAAEDEAGDEPEDDEAPLDAAESALPEAEEARSVGAGVDEAGSAEPRDADAEPRDADAEPRDADAEPRDAEDAEPRDADALRA